jgi:hypothetical protein
MRKLLSGLCFGKEDLLIPLLVLQLEFARLL